MLPNLVCEQRLAIHRSVVNCWRWVWKAIPMIRPDNELLVIQSNITLAWDASYTAFFIPVRLLSVALETLPLRLLTWSMSLTTAHL